MAGRKARVTFTHPSRLSPLDELQRVVEEGLGAVPARGVHQDGRRAGQAEHGVGQGRDGLVVGDVGAQELASAAGLLEVGDEDPGAGGGQQVRRGLADSGGAAGHDGAAALEAVGEVRCHRRGI
jgi:hypothetical protein